MKYLILGAGIAGTTCAETIRKIDPQGKITLVGDEPHRLYTRVNLRSYLKGMIPREKLFLKNDAFYTKQNIQYITGLAVQSIDGGGKVVHAVMEQKASQDKKNASKSMRDSSLDSSTHAFVYDKLCIATGGKPRMLDVPGREKQGVYNLYTMDDTDAIQQELQTAKVGGIVGGGFIAGDLIGIFAKHNMETHVFLRESGFWSHILAEDGVTFIQKALERHNVQIHSHEIIKNIEGGAHIQKIVTEKNFPLPNPDSRLCTSYPCDILGVGIGILPSTTFLENSAIKTNTGILTNEYLETSVPDVWAAGDVAYFYDLLFNESHRLGNWTNATMHGRIAGKNMTGMHLSFVGISSYTTDILDVNVSFIGNIQAKKDVQIEAKRTGGSYVQLHRRSGETIGAIVMNDPESRGCIIQEFLKKQQTLSL